MIRVLVLLTSNGFSMEKWEGTDWDMAGAGMSREKKRHDYPVEKTTSTSRA